MPKPGIVLGIEELCQNIDNILERLRVLEIYASRLGYKLDRPYCTQCEDDKPHNWVCTECGNIQPPEQE